MIEYRPSFKCQHCDKLNRFDADELDGGARFCRFCGEYLGSLECADGQENTKDRKLREFEEYVKSRLPTPYVLHQEDPGK